jgi:hypothetical protein
MKYLKRFNEDVSATGGNLGAITGGEVYNMPVSGDSTLGPNSIGNNVGSINMNNTLPDQYDTEDEEPNQEAKQKQKKKKSKIQTELEDSDEEKIEKEEQPVMNWDTFVKKNINKIQ